MMNFESIEKIQPKVQPNRKYGFDFGYVFTWIDHENFKQKNDMKIYIKNGSINYLT